MPSLVPTPTLSPQCLSCCRRFLIPSQFVYGLRPQTQVRGKKNAHGPTHLNVRLVKDLKGYGRKGSLVPVPVGVMRNVWFPQRIADYVSVAETRELKRSKAVVERDYEFGKAESEIAKDAGAGAEIKRTTTSFVRQPARSTRAADTIRIDLDQLEPKDAFEALSQALPSHVNFYRSPIESSEAQTPSSASDSQAEPSLNIYGSVTTADIATNLKALLASTDLAGKIVLADDDIRFVTQTTSEGQEHQEESKRVKQLGNYDIEIRVKGHNEAIRRQVRVISEGDAPAGAAELEAHPELIEELAAENPIAGGEESPELLSLEAQVEELEATIEEARRAMSSEGGEVSTTGGAGDFGRESGSESRPGASNEGSVGSRLAPHEISKGTATQGDRADSGPGPR